MVHIGGGIRNAFPSKCGLFVEYLWGVYQVPTGVFTLTYLNPQNTSKMGSSVLPNSE